MMMTLVIFLVNEKGRVKSKGVKNKEGVETSNWQEDR